MWEILIPCILLIAAIGFWIWFSRRRSIVDVKGRNKHFASLAKQLQFSTGGDEFFVQLEGTWKDIPSLIYPHSFEGPGSITVFYFDTGVPYVDRNWIEPGLSLGRAIVDWKRNIPFDFEISGSVLPAQEILTELKGQQQKFPFVAVTLPTRFILSHYMMQSLNIWKNFVVILVLDAGRKPSLTEIQNTLDAGMRVVKIVNENKS